ANYLFSSSWTTWFRTASEAPQMYVTPTTLPADGRPAIIDLASPNFYAGLLGGLYDNYSNAIPSDHESAGIAAAGAIVRRATDGTPSGSGKIVFLGLGWDG